MALSPDLVVGYSGNEEALAPDPAAGAPVLILNPVTWSRSTPTSPLWAPPPAPGSAAEVVESLKAQIKAVADAAAATGESPKVFYALDNTLWTAGPGSFVDELLTLAHATNVAAPAGRRQRRRAALLPVRSRATGGRRPGRHPAPRLRVHQRR